jgi:hypothetical protein
MEDKAQSICLLACPLALPAPRATARPRIRTVRDLALHASMRPGSRPSGSRISSASALRSCMRRGEIPRVCAGPCAEAVHGLAGSCRPPLEDPEVQSPAAHASLPMRCNVLRATVPVAAGAPRHAWITKPASALFCVAHTAPRVWPVRAGGQVARAGQLQGGRSSRGACEVHTAVHPTCCSDTLQTRRRRHV